MSSVNKVIVVGNLGRDPQYQILPQFQAMEKVIHRRVGVPRKVAVDKLVARTLWCSSIPHERLNSAQTSLRKRKKIRCEEAVLLPGQQWRIRLRRCHARELQPDRHLLLIYSQERGSFSRV